MTLQNYLQRNVVSSAGFITDNYHLERPSRLEVTLSSLLLNVLTFVGLYASEHPSQMEPMQEIARVEKFRGPDDDWESLLSVN